MKTLIDFGLFISVLAALAIVESGKGQPSRQKPAHAQDERQRFESRQNVVIELRNEGLPSGEHFARAKFREELRSDLVGVQIGIKRSELAS